MSGALTATGRTGTACTSRATPSRIARMFATTGRPARSGDAATGTLVFRTANWTFMARAENVSSATVGVFASTAARPGELPETDTTPLFTSTFFLAPSVVKRAFASRINPAGAAAQSPGCGVGVAVVTERAESTGTGDPAAGIALTGSDSPGRFGSVAAEPTGIPSGRETRFRGSQVDFAPALEARGAETQANARGDSVAVFACPTASSSARGMGVAGLLPAVSGAVGPGGTAGAAPLISGNCLTIGSCGFRRSIARRVSPTATGAASPAKPEDVGASRRAREVGNTAPVAAGRVGTGPARIPPRSGAAEGAGCVFSAESWVPTGFNTTGVIDESGAAAGLAWTTGSVVPLAVGDISSKSPPVSGWSPADSIAAAKFAVRVPFPAVSVPLEATDTGPDGDASHCTPWVLRTVGPEQRPSRRRGSGVGIGPAGVAADVISRGLPAADAVWSSATQAGTAGETLSEAAAGRDVS